MKTQTINVLGAEYFFVIRKYQDDPEFARLSCDGYHDGPARIMAVCDLNTHPAYAHESKEHKREYMKVVARHEIEHAFLYQSGLAQNSGEIAGGWAMNEEMVDWHAIQMPKIVAACKQVGAL